MAANKSVAKKIMASFLAAAMTFSLLPRITGKDNVHAAPIAKDKDNTCLGTTGIAAPDAPANQNSAWSGSYVYFGAYGEGESAKVPIRFRVLAPSTTAYGSSTLFLDSDATLFNKRFDDDSNVWANSELRAALNNESDEDSFLNSSFSPLEKGAIAESTVGEHDLVNGTEAGQVTNWTANVFKKYVPLTGEKIFVLDAEETSNVAYGYSNKDTDCSDRVKDGSYAWWWLRSALSNNISAGNAGIVGYDGNLNSIIVNELDGVAPALNVKQDSILFSTIVNDGNFKEAGTEYKLTLIDNELNVIVPTEENLSVSGKKITVPFTLSGDHADASTTASVLILNREYVRGDYDGAKILYYAPLDNDGSFTLTDGFDLDKWGTNYFVYIIAENRNDEAKGTDYAGEPVKLNKPGYYLSKSAGNTRLGTSQISAPYQPKDGQDLPWTGSYVYFGAYGEGDSAKAPIRFRVLAPSTTAYGEKPTLFLDSDKTLFRAYFDRTSPESNSWADSDIRATLNGSFLNGFTDLEKAAIAMSSGTGGFSSYAAGSYAEYRYTSPVSVNDKVFLLDATEVTNPAYGYVADEGWDKPDDVAWTEFSFDYYHTVTNRIKGGSSAFWWLRSARGSSSNRAGEVYDDGTLDYGNVDFSYYGVAPALNVDQKSIIFSSEITKPDDDGYNGEYKLTVKDSNMGIDVTDGKSISIDGTTVTVPYTISIDGGSNATRASVLILDAKYKAGNNDDTNILYYGKLGDAPSGTGTFELPSGYDLSGWGSDYFVYFLAEDIHGAQETDYASEPAEIKFSVTVENGVADKATAVPGETITVVANAPKEGSEFVKWTTDSSDVALVDPQSTLTTFTMPAASVKVTATYQDLAEWSKSQDNTDLGTTQISAPYQPKDGQDLPWTGSYVYFGAYGEGDSAKAPIRFRVLAPSTTAYGEKPTLFLDSDNTVIKNDFGNNTNVWADSQLRTYLNGDFINPTNEFFTESEVSAIAVSKGDGGLSYADPSFGATAYGAPVNVNDKVFLLDATEVMNPAYGYSADCGLETTSDWTWTAYLNSDWTNHEVANREKGVIPHFWFLRSGNSNFKLDMGYVDLFGRLDFRRADADYYVAPALNVDHEAILFSSVISGTAGKYGAEYKLTVFDSDLVFGVQKDKNVTSKGTTITVPYAITGDDSKNATQVSVLILNDEFEKGNAKGASVLYYGKLDGTFGTTSEGTFTLPSTINIDDWGLKYHVYAFAEDVNGRYETDYASDLLKLSKPVAVKDLDVSITWNDDDDAQKLRSDSVTLDLYAGEDKVDGKSLTLNADNKWKGTFADLPVSDGTNDIEYTVKPSSVPAGYEVSVKPSTDGVSVTFSLKTYNVTLTTDGNGTASATPASGNPGTEVTLTATPDTGYKFKEWQVTDGGVTITDNKFTIGTADVEINVVFEKQFYPVTVVSGTTATATAAMGDLVEITASAPVAGKEFDKWTADSDDVVFDNAGSATTTFTMPAGAVTVTATYKDIVYGVTVTTDGNGTASAKAASGTMGTEVTLTATPNTGYKFKEWQVISGGVTITDDKFTIGTEAVEIKAVFELESYAVTVNSGKADKTTANMGDTVEITAAAPEAGKEFDKWVVVSGKITLADETKATTTFTMPAGDVEVTATYKDIPTYTVKVTTDGNGTASASIEKGVSGTEVTLKAVPDTGYKFKEWVVVSGDVTITSDKFTIGTENVEIKAVFEEITYPVTVTSGSADKDTASAGETVTITADAPAEGQEFIKWVVVSGKITLADETKTVTTFTMPSEGVEVKATYKDIDSYSVKVTVEGEGSATADPASGIPGTTVTLKATPDMGYAFKEWIVVSGGVTITSDKFTIGTEDVEIKAVFEKVAYSVTVNSGTADKEKATIGETVTVIADEPAEGKEFVKWTVVSGNITLDDETKATTTFKMPAEAVEITAIYKDINSLTVTVTDDGNGSATADPDSGIPGTKVTLSAEPAEGYALKEWKVISGDVTIKDNEFTIGTTDVEIQAVFEKVPYEITVISGASDKATAVIGDIVTVTADAPETGKEFDKWVSEDVTFTDAMNPETTFTMPAKDVKVTATYKDLGSCSITVTDDGNGKAVSDIASGFTGTTVTITAEANTGYQFKEWKVVSGDITLDDKTKAETTFTIGTENVTVQAVFEKITYKVTVNNGEADMSTATMGDEVEITADAPADGKYFYMWEVVSGDVELDDETDSTTTFTMPAEDVEITAVYKDIPKYTVEVTTDGNGTAEASVDEAVEGTTVTITAEPSTGYKFKEWEVVSGGVDLTDKTSAETTFKIGTEDVEIKAVFELALYPVTVTSGKADKTEAAMGETVTLTADAPADGKMFDKWVVNSGSITLADPTSATTTFVMSAGAVDVTATYKDAPVQIYYFFKKGADGTFVVTENAVFEVSRSADDEHCIDYFDWVAIDGIKLEPGKDCLITTGSTVITIYSDYLKTLKPGEHKIIVNFVDGSVAANFTLKAAESGESIPSTGEQTDITSFIGIGLVIAVFAGVTVAVVRKRKEEV